MKKSILIVIVLLALTVNLNAQLWKLRRWEASAGPGMTQFYGDIGGFSRGKNVIGIKDFTYLQTRYNVDMSLRYRIMSNVSVRLNFNFGKFHATDIRGSNEGRGFESLTSFFEPDLIGEYYYVKNKGENSFLMLRGRKKQIRTLASLIDAYAFTGIGGISYRVKPNAALAAKGRSTSGFAPVIPVGLGTNFNYSRNLNFGIELGGRYAFTDNLEGYSSVFSERNDVYFFFNLNVIYKIKMGYKSSL